MRWWSPGQDEKTDSSPLGPSDAVKVAVVSNELTPQAGGRFTFQQTLAEALRQAEQQTHHRFLFITRGLTRDAPGPWSRVLRRAASHVSTRIIQVIHDAQDRALGTRIVHIRTGLERRLDAEGIDLVWFSGYYAEDCDRPFIFTVLDLQYLEQPWFPEVGRRGQFETRRRHCERYVPKATRVIVPNEAGLEQLLRHFPLTRERVLLLPHPTPTWALEAAEKNPASSSLSIDDLRDPFLLYPAQFWSHKNHVTLLRALAEVNRRRSDRRFQLVCVGTDKGGRARVEHLVDELSLREDVIFSGFVELDQLVALYRRAYALVFLSWFGPENLPPLEAFALGCPVIYADVPGAREQAGNAALLVPPDQPEQVADAILSLEDDDVRSQLIEAGRERARKNSVDQYVGGVIEFLDQFEAVRSCWS